MSTALPPVRFSAVLLDASRCTLPSPEKPTAVYWCGQREPSVPPCTADHLPMDEGHDWRWDGEDIHVFYNNDQAGTWILLQWGEGENKMPCYHCGEEIPLYSRFCMWCGEAL